MSRLHSISIFVFAIAIATYGYLQWQKSQMPAIDTIVPEETPTFIANKLSTSKYDGNGNLAHTIYAEKMTHYALANETLIEGPQYTVYPSEDTGEWHLTANKGKLGDDNILVLSDRVRLISKDNNSFISEIHGKSLVLDLTNSIISSEQSILIKGRDFTMYGSGLRVDTHKTTMTLSEHVQTIYKKNAS